MPNIITRIIRKRRSRGSSSGDFRDELDISKHSSAASAAILGSSRNRKTIDLNLSNPASAAGAAGPVGSQELFDADGSSTQWSACEATVALHASSTSMAASVTEAPDVPLVKLVEPPPLKPSPTSNMSSSELSLEVGDGGDDAVLDESIATQSSQEVVQQGQDDAQAQQVHEEQQHIASSTAAAITCVESNIDDVQDAVNKDAIEKGRGGGDTTNINKTKPHVSFSTLTIREYPIEIGDNPSVVKGVPVTIGWKYDNEYNININAYEASRPPRRYKLELRTESLYRVRMLKHLGYSANEIRECLNQVNIEHSKRQRTKDLLRFEPIQTKFELVQRAILNATVKRSAKKQEREYLKDYMKPQEVVVDHDDEDDGDEGFLGNKMSPVVVTTRTTSLMTTWKTKSSLKKTILNQKDDSRKSTISSTSTRATSIMSNASMSRHGSFCCGGGGGNDVGGEGVGVSSINHLGELKVHI